MKFNKIKILSLVALTLTISGCGSNDGADDNQALVNDGTDTLNGNGIDVPSSIQTSGGTATPVPSISSAQMSEFIGNPLLAAIPAELSGSKSGSSSSVNIGNPLLD